MLFFRLIKESFLFASHAIVVNKLRTLLSLLGITIGIFAIISVFTVVDSLEKTIRNSIASLGDNVVFIQKWPWEFGGDYKWWQYMSRPDPKLKEAHEVQRRSQSAAAVAFSISMNKTVEYLNRSIEDVVILPVSHDYYLVKNFNISEGRYFSDFESVGGKAVCIIGSDIKDNLFDEYSPLDKTIKMMGRKLHIIGVFEKEGEDTFGNSSDNMICMPILFMRNLVDINSEMYNPLIWVKAKENVSTEAMKDELRGIMRSIRKLKPVADDNFALNETSMLSQGFDGLFVVIGLAGWIIGGFSILVGGFGIANIMFVSVKERTNIIGIQKSVGAKNYFILLQFLFEAVILCLIGGVVGLILIYAGTLIASQFMEMNISLSMSNIVLGLSVSLIIGLVSGFLPAFRASKLNPVEAIRSNQ
ncbi:MAG: ABC transporter permease [Bacteroidales bacterium]|nr:ABC transporter permease [Bacteroidales bacterium]